MGSSRQQFRYVIRPIYVTSGPDYCLIFDNLNQLRQDGNIVPNTILSYKGNLHRTLCGFLCDKWKLAVPYFADPEDVIGYQPVAIAVQ